MSDSRIKEAIRYRNYVHEISSDEWEDGLQKAWTMLVDALCENMTESSQYISFRCTEAEFSYFSEVIDDVIIRSNSKEFIKAMYDAADKYPAESEKFKIKALIADGEKLLR